MSETIKCRYVGRYAAVYVPTPEGNVEATKGEPVAFPADIAAGLLSQPSNWQPSGAAAKEVADEARESVQQAQEADAPPAATPKGG